MKTEQAYKEVLDVVKRHRDVCVFDVNDMESKAKHHLFGIELKEKYGFNLDPREIHSCEWIRVGEYLKIGLYGEKHRRTISLEDNNQQPDDELLFKISFPTGAYIFGDDYPTELFKEFWDELKSYNPKYIDTINKNLYFSMENASKVFNEFSAILKKYHDKNKEDFKIRRIKKMEAELNRLKEGKANDRG